MGFHLILAGEGCDAPGGSEIAFLGFPDLDVHHLPWFDTFLLDNFPGNCDHQTPPYFPDLRQGQYDITSYLFCNTQYMKVLQREEREGRGLQARVPFVSLSRGTDGWFQWALPNVGF